MTEVTPEQASQTLRRLASETYGSVEGESVQELFEVAASQFSSSKLSKWRSEVIKRDGLNCWMCGDTRHIEAHHIYPKSMYPVLAYEIKNGVMLCYRCHRVIVHGSNTWDLTSWQRFVPLWSKTNERPV